MFHFILLQRYGVDSFQVAEENHVLPGKIFHQMAKYNPVIDISSITKIFKYAYLIFKI